MLCMNSHFSATGSHINYDAMPKNQMGKNHRCELKKINNNKKTQQTTNYHSLLPTHTNLWTREENFNFKKIKTEKKGYGTSIHGLFHMCHSYPRNLVPGGPSWRMRLTKLSPSFRGGGAVGRWSLLSSNSSEGKREHKQFGAEFPIFNDIFYLGLPNCGLYIKPPFIKLP